MPLETQLIISAINGNQNNVPVVPAQHQEHHEKRRRALILTVILIELILWIWAILRALKCSSVTDPASRTVHLLFATLTPTLYLLFSFFPVFGLCTEHFEEEEEIVVEE